MVFILLAIWQLKNLPKAKVFGTRAPDKALPHAAMVLFDFVHRSEVIP
jgi:hypothetical protein